jgi:hypothetical protein
VFTLAQAARGGLTRGQIRHRIRRGVWRRLAGKGWVVAEESAYPHAEVHAMRLTWPDATVWGPSALRHWEREAPLPPADALDCAVPHFRAAQPGLRPHEVNVPDGDAVIWEATRIQRRAPALAATLTVLPEPQARSLLAWMIARRKIKPEEFALTVESYAQRPGVRRLRAYQPLVAARAASELELQTRAVLIAHNITGWEPNALVRLANGQVRSVDFWFKAARVAVMNDGYAYHSSRQAFQTDRSDQNQFVVSGIRVLRFTAQDIKDRPAEVAHQIAVATGQTARRAA